MKQSEHAAKKRGEWEGEGSSCVELILPSGEIPMTAHSSTTKHLMHWPVSRVAVGKSHKMRLKNLDDASCSLSLTQWCQYLEKKIKKIEKAREKQVSKKK